MGRVSIYAHPEDAPHASSALANYGLVGAMLACISSVLVATIGGACILYMSVAAQENVNGETAHTPVLRHQEYMRSVDEQTLGAHAVSGRAGASR